MYERAELRIDIPMKEGVRSLNRAVAGGIALSEALRKTGIEPGGLLGTGNNRRHAIGSRACAIAYACNSKRSSVRTEAMHASLTRLGIGRRRGSGPAKAAAASAA